MLSLPTLPLTPFERYMLADDQRGYPMVAVLQIQLGGCLLPDLLRTALVPALERHPLMVARVAGRDAVAAWDTTHPWHVNDVLQVDGEPTLPGISESGHIDLTQTNGIKIRVSSSSNATQITFLLHHAVADGLGIMEFVADWFGHYDRLFKQQTTELRRPAWTVEALVNRGHSRWIIAEPITRWQGMRSFAVETARWLFRRPQPLRATQASVCHQPTWPELSSITLSVAETQQLRSVADNAQVTVNDVLLRDLFVALARWQNQGQLQPRRKWLRINVPTSLRLPGELPLPACNVLGYVFLTHREAECTSRDKLLAAVASEMAGVRRWNLGQFFLDGLVKAEKMPGVVRWFTNSKQCMATTVFSNLGDVRRFFRKILERRGPYYYVGDVPLLKITAAPPVRPGTHAVFLAAICGDELTISLRAHPGMIASDEQAELLALFRQELDKSLSSPPRS